MASLIFTEQPKRQGSTLFWAARYMWRPNSRFDKEAGAEEDRYYHLVLLAENNQGYANLMKIVSKGFVEGFYYKPRVDLGAA